MLAHLELTTRTYEEFISSLHKFAHEVSSGRIVALGGGGYNPANVARCWTLVAASLSEATLTNDLPDKWKAEFRQVSRVTPPDMLRTTPSRGHDSKRGLAEMQKNIEDLKRRLPMLSRLQ
jgi:acetoin utilization protein AcuC